MYRYIISQKIFKHAHYYLMELMNVDINDFKPKEPLIHDESDYSPRIVNEELCDELLKANIDFSSEFDDRFLRSHGSALRDLYIIRYGKFKRIPDLVVWPTCHEDVVLIVKLANKYFSIIIPCGGSTNTMMSLSYMKNDNSRLLISVDTTQMNKVLWIDKTSMLACVEAGIVGKDMENVLEKNGLTVGHEPDSVEFSTVGGWVATRSSGMKQQAYGNIEDIVTRLTMVTSVGVLEKNFIVPRASVGPNFDHIILGSEGTLGIITKVVLRIHPKPKVKRFGSIVFPDFDRGINFMREVSTFSKKPSSIRLNDYYHINLGFAFEYNKSLIGSIVDSIKRVGAQYLYGLDLKKISLAVYCIEGDKKDADDVEKNLFRITGKYGGTKTSRKYGERGFLLTHTNGYIRVGVILFNYLLTLTFIINVFSGFFLRFGIFD
jgi:alkyldihydroxyacetonephosphate synthase